MDESEIVWVTAYGWKTAHVVRKQSIYLMPPALCGRRPSADWYHLTNPAAEPKCKTCLRILTTQYIVETK